MNSTSTEDVDFLEDLEIARVARVRIKAGGATSLDDLAAQVGFDLKDE